MAYITEETQLGIVPALFAVGSAGYKYGGALSRLFGGDLTADRGTVERWYNSMPAWAKQVITIDDLMATEQQSRGAGSIVQWSKDLNGTSLVKGNWTQAHLAHFENDLSIATSKTSSEPDKHDFWVLNGTLVAAILNIAQYGNPAGPQQPAQPPPTRPGLPRGAQPVEITTPGGRRPPIEERPPVQEAGFGGMPSWLIPLILVGAGVGMFAMKGRR